LGTFIWNLRSDLYIEAGADQKILSWMYLLKGGEAAPEDVIVHFIIGEVYRLGLGRKGLPKHKDEASGAKKEKLDDFKKAKRIWLKL